MNMFGNTTMENQDCYQESTPELRSVAIASRASAFAAPKFAAPLLKSRASPLAAATTTTTSAQPIGESWKMEMSELMDVPPFKELRRNAIATEFGLEVVLSRVSSFMRSKAIKCDLNKEESLIECSVEDLQFVVHVWRGPKTGKVVINLERRAGCACQTQGLRRRLYKSLQSQTPEVSAIPSAAPRMPMSRMAPPSGLPPVTIPPLVMKSFGEQGPIRLPVLPPPPIKLPFAVRN